MSKNEAMERLSGLTIGDWVNIASPHKVTGIQMSDGVLCVQTDYTDTYYSIENYEPVPLTCEILNKHFPDTRHDVYWWGSIDREGETELKIDLGDDKRIELSVRYVHELQHALRLAGVRKEVVL